VPAALTACTPVRLRRRCWRRRASAYRCAICRRRAAGERHCWRARCLTLRTTHQHGTCARHLPHYLSASERGWDRTTLARFHATTSTPAESSATRRVTKHGAAVEDGARRRDLALPLCCSGAQWRGAAHCDGRFFTPVHLHARACAARRIASLRTDGGATLLRRCLFACLLLTLPSPATSPLWDATTSAFPACVAVPPWIAAALSPAAVRHGGTFERAPCVPSGETRRGRLRRYLLLATPVAKDEEQEDDAACSITSTQSEPFGAGCNGWPPRVRNGSQPSMASPPSSLHVPVLAKRQEQWLLRRRCLLVAPGVDAAGAGGRPYGRRGCLYPPSLAACCAGLQLAG